MKGLPSIYTSLVQTALMNVLRLGRVLLTYSLPTL